MPYSLLESMEKATKKDGEGEERRISENSVLRMQCDEIQHYADQFPVEEREERMLELIEKYAHTYRQHINGLISFIKRTAEEQDSDTLKPNHSDHPTKE